MTNYERAKQEADEAWVAIRKGDAEMGFVRALCALAFAQLAAIDDRDSPASHGTTHYCGSCDKFAP